MSSHRAESTQVFMLEFNELCPSLLRQFIGEGKLPNFRRMYETSAVYTTDAEAPPPRLEPWIQWATVHSGLSFAEHGAFHLGDGRKIEQKCLAELLSDAGVRVGVFGSMNTNYSNLNGYYIPDPWDVDAQPQPRLLKPFFDTVSQQVQESSKSGGLSKKELIRFGSFMLRHGLRRSTIAATIRQLLLERRDPGFKWRRASLLENIQYDLFCSLQRRLSPRFCTFFCNSTAHYQHYYWRNMHPEIFTVPPGAEDHPSLQTAIEYGYRQMDALVGRFMSDFPQATLILITALSQQPWTETTKCTYRPKEFKALLRLAGLDPAEVMIKPVMAEEFHMRFSGESAALAAHELLAALTIGDAPLLKLEMKGCNIFGGCAVTNPQAMRGRISGAQSRSEDFSDLFHMVHSMRSGRHHPDGVLWICDGMHSVSEGKVRLTDITPTILDRFKVQKPQYMTGAPIGRTHDSTARHAVAV